MARFIWTYADGSSHLIEWDGVTPLGLQEGETIVPEPPQPEPAPPEPLPTAEQEAPHVVD